MVTSFFGGPFYDLGFYEEQPLGGAFFYGDFFDGDFFLFVPVPENKPRPIGGGGTGFLRQGRISRPEERVRGTKTYIEKPRRTRQDMRRDNDIIEFVVKFTCDFL